MCESARRLARASEFRHLEAIPARYVSLEALPCTPTGKVNPRALPGPGTARPELDEPYAPPASPVEEELVALLAARVLPSLLSRAEEATFEDLLAALE